MYKASVHVTLRPSILDPKGKATENALHQLGVSKLKHVRIGKLIEMEVDASSEAEAREVVESACQKVLANEVMEVYHIELVKG